MDALLFRLQMSFRAIDNFAYLAHHPPDLIRMLSMYGVTLDTQ